MLNCEAAKCSIYESGLMFWNALRDGTEFDLSYREISTFHDIPQHGFDFYLFNYHHTTMLWLDTRRLAELPGAKLTFVLEMTATDPFAFCPSADFDAYLVPDPTHRCADPRVFAVPRPLEAASALPVFVPPAVPWIGTFGFATPGKGFESVVQAVGAEFDRAVVRINMPLATHADPSGELARQYAKRCQELAKPGIEVRTTHEYLDKQALIRWCAQNTLNAFLYDRNQTGLAATTDQALASGRPLVVSRCDTFRHIHEHLRPYPELTLREAIATSATAVARMLDLWSPRSFRAHFLRVLEGLAIPAPPQLPRQPLLFVTQDADAEAKRLFHRLQSHFGSTIGAGVANSAPEVTRLTREHASRVTLWHARSPVPDAAKSAVVASVHSLPIVVLDAQRLCGAAGSVQGPLGNYATADSAARAAHAPLREEQRPLVLHVRSSADGVGEPRLAPALAQLQHSASRAISVGSLEEFVAATAHAAPDVVVYEYSWSTMPWLCSSVIHAIPAAHLAFVIDPSSLDSSDGELFDRVVLAADFPQAAPDALDELEHQINQARSARADRAAWESARDAGDGTRWPTRTTKGASPCSAPAATKLANAGLAVVAFGTASEVLACTPLARQLAILAPGIPITWYTTAAGREVLAGNPDISVIEVVADDGSGLEAQLAQAVGALAHRHVFRPLAARQPAPPGWRSRVETIRSNTGLAWTTPHVPVFRLFPAEVRAARGYVNRLPTGTRILIDSSMQRDATACSAAQAFAIGEAFAELDATFILAGATPPAWGMQFKERWPKTVWCREPVRLGAELLNHCSAFIGFGGTLTALASTDWCRPDLPRIEFPSDESLSSAECAHLEAITICFEDSRFRAALASTAAVLRGEAAPSPSWQPRTPDASSCPSCARVASVAEAPGFVRCERCGLVRGEPAASATAQRAPLAPEHRQRYLDAALRLRGASSGNPRVLEIGGPHHDGCRSAADFLAANVPPASVDVILAIHALHQDTNAALLLAKAHQALRPGGHLWIATPNWESYARRALGQDWPWFTGRLHFTAKTLRAELIQCGFVVQFLRTPLGAARADTVLAAIRRARPDLEAGAVAAFFTELIESGRGEELLVLASRRGRKPGAG